MKSIILAIIIGIGLILYSIGLGVESLQNQFLSHKNCYIAETLSPSPTFYTIEMNVSAYCPCSLCCGKFADGITASGNPAEGFFVAAPPNIPFGTLLVVPGYADGCPVPVWDRGGAIKDNKLDVFFPTHQEALNWGRQQLNVKILTLQENE